MNNVRFLRTITSSSHYDVVSLKPLTEITTKKEKRFEDYLNIEKRKFIERKDFKIGAKESFLYTNLPEGYCEKIHTTWKNITSDDVYYWLKDMTQYANQYCIKHKFPFYFIKIKRKCSETGPLISLETHLLFGFRKPEKIPRFNK